LVLGPSSLSLSLSRIIIIIKQRKETWKQVQSPWVLGSWAFSFLLDSLEAFEKDIGPNLVGPLFEVLAKLGRRFRHLLCFNY
jgi:hypothetical protein